MASDRGGNGSCWIMFAWPFERSYELSGDVKSVKDTNVDANKQRRQPFCANN